MPEPIRFSSYDIQDHLLMVTFKDPSIFQLDKTVKVGISERNSDSLVDYTVDLVRIGTEFGFYLDLNTVPFLLENKTILDLYVYTDDETAARLFKPVPELKERSLKYVQTPYHINAEKIAVLYLTTKNELSLIYGNKAEIYKSFCTFIHDRTFVKDLKVTDKGLEFGSGIHFNQLEDFYFLIDKRKSNQSTVIPYELYNETVVLDLKSQTWTLKSRYDLFLHIKVGRIIQAFRIHVKDEYAQRFYDLVDIEEKLKLLPYITTKGEISFVAVDHWLYDYERSTKEIKDLQYDKLIVTQNKLTIHYNQEQISEILADKKWSLEIKSTKNTSSLLIDPTYYNFGSDYLEIDLAKALAPSKFHVNEKWEFYLKAYNSETDLIEIFKLKKQTVWAAGNNERYFKPVSLSDSMDAIVYISAKNDLGLLFGDKFTYQKLMYTQISSNISIQDLRFSDEGIQFKLSDIPPHKIEMLRIILTERKAKDNWTVEIDPSVMAKQGTIFLDLSEFIDKFQYSKSRWDISLEVAHDHLIESGKIGTFYDELAPKHLRYFEPIATRGNTVFVPYLSIYNELVIVVNEKTNVDNERVAPKLALTDFSMSGSKIVGTVEVEVADVDQFTVNEIMLKFRGKADENIEYKLPVTSFHFNGSKGKAGFEIDVAVYEFQPFYWDIYLLIDLDGSIYPVKIKNPSSEVKEQIDTKITQYSFTYDNGYFIYPYISGANTLALTYREKPSYEANAFKIKENIAYYTYRLFQKYFDRKDIWLGYEKFSEGAQDNGYYFFKYCYENNKKKDFYYIIKKDSPDYENVAHMKDKVIEFMSFKYMIYMYAAKLLVSSESKGHVYDIRIQKGKLLQALKKKKHVFLQHGVTALKRVDYVFRKTKNSAVDLFIATSDYEKNIIKQYFNYNEDEIAVTGFCRWDVLEDTSGEEKEIFVMPTWRTWMDDLPEEQFVESDYYKNYVGFFQSERLKKLLDNNNVKLSFYIHPKFKTYIDSFHVENGNMKIYQYGEEKVNTLLMKSSMLITDYSSVAWEMYYQKKPVVFFQFDVDKYTAFQGSYLDMETELFGDRAFTVDELVDSVEEYIGRDFKEKEEFGTLRSKYFKYVDKKNCERTYKAIKAFIKKSKNKGNATPKGNKK
ncbi:CDP-glycerol glycerophosphotransferase family protein [Neobacillus cucumis]|uniref:CDP-glycerol glycerophosphotransferase family protein n=1 Tax=Neobacillus cucumis TaxID=1740721 RepID=UPI002E1ADBD1|nr:CDP-glycerol glycerophosphotransferase family protein [Neobacillus cucumis]MED4224282.1 CDP-glycerol glycerophosphotransferase family protein [Neobacillus cucumis]